MSSANGQSLRSASTTGDGKAPAASPKTTPEEVEMSDVQNGEPAKSIPLENDIMQCARLGEVGLIRKMFDSGNYKPDYRDEEGITPLHWAAINNQYATCKFLVEQGADVNAKGGESVATPAMWAAQRCHYYVVNLLLKMGADPLLVDGQGYNILHLATIDGNAFLLVLLLHQDIAVDVVDPQQHTSLMWAAYKGYPACVDLLLRWGANVNARDDKGLTPLHWALVKGSQQCIQKIIEFGGDRFAETNDGKDPHTVAEEMRSTRMWHRALAECGYDTNGNSKAFPLGLGAFLKNPKMMSRFYFFYPFIPLFLIISIISYNVIYIGIPIAFAVAWALQLGLQRISLLGPGKFRNLHHTPYLAGWFAASLFFVGARWVYWILPSTFTTNTFMNLLFAIIYGLLTFFYFVSMMEDPGFVPRLNSRNKERDTIEELFSLWKFDEENFCIQYIEQLPRISNPQCTLLSDEVCNLYKRDTWTWILAGWSCLQLVWVSMLLMVQTVQILRGQTTLENMRNRNMDSIPGNTSQAVTAALTAGTTSLGAAGLTSSGMGPNPTTADTASVPKKPKGFCGRWSQILGLDTFIATARGGLIKDPATGKLQPRQRPKNLFSRGIIGNCKDFWMDPAPYFGRRTGAYAMLGGQVVNYARMYDVPRQTTGGRGMVYTSLAGQADPEDDV
ncbi:putative palmitoyltransferase akr1 [Phaeomoniella chlamydospora]|uniref:protein S-acyltransferase n=1 Tax=Phaeomoniella chlamydospora TaxID=158046 RepID=A0A0G2ELJ9_PHACM|nr:putative palmitoyltransferase akr1 [Phaeomoniella chlamydospora]